MTFDINDNDIFSREDILINLRTGVSLSKITGVLQCSHTHSATKPWVGILPSVLVSNEFT